MAKVDGTRGKRAVLKAPSSPRRARVDNGLGIGSERRAAILRVAEELFSQKGISNTTVRDIGEAAGILSGSLYHHFTSKEAMVAEVLTEYLDAILRDYEDVEASYEEPVERLRGLVRASFAAIDRDPWACSIYQNEHKYLASMPGLEEVHRRSDRIQKYWLGAIEGGVSKGALRKDIPARIFYSMLRDSVWFTVRWYHAGGRYSLDRLTDMFMEVFMNGFSTSRE